MGRTRLIRASFSFDIFGRADRADDVRLQGGLDGGGLMDVGCYCVSALRLLAGEPERVSGRQVTRDGVDVRFAGTLALPGGVLGVLRLRARHGRPLASWRWSATRRLDPRAGPVALARRAASSCAGPAGPRS